jgi:hypothetical protein
MEIAASSKGLPSILSLDYETLQNLELYRGGLCLTSLNSCSILLSPCILWDKSAELDIKLYHGLNKNRLSLS